MLYVTLGLHPYLPRTLYSSSTLFRNSLTYRSILCVHYASVTKTLTNFRSHLRQNSRMCFSITYRITHRFTHLFIPCTVLLPAKNRLNFTIEVPRDENVRLQRPIFHYDRYVESLVEMCRGDWGKQV